MGLAARWSANGDAPANIAYHAHELDANCQAITRVGKDDLGRAILKWFRGMGLATEAVQEDDTPPTGTTGVSLSGDGQAHFTILENVPRDFLAATREAEAAVRAADAIFFGSLASGMRPRRDSAATRVFCGEVARNGFRVTASNR